MKTLTHILKKAGTWCGVGLSALWLASCGASRNTASNDGIYGDQNQQTAQQTNGGNGYKQYFQSLREDEVFTDVDRYSSAQDSTYTAQGYTSGNGSWGSETDQVVVNVYGGNTWGWNYWNNYWYGPYWGTGWGWGWNSWYGWGGYGGWGWGYPYWGYGYGYGWGYPSPYYGGYYAYNPGIRGGRTEYYNGGGSYNGRNSVSRLSTPSRGRSTGLSYTTTGGRNAVYSNGTGRNGSYSSTRATSPVFTGGRNTNSGRGYSPVYSNGSGRNNSYTPSGSGRSSGGSQPSYSGGRSSGGSSGGGGGRSFGGGGGGGRSGGGGGGRR